MFITFLVRVNSIAFLRYLYLLACLILLCLSGTQALLRNNWSLGYLSAVSGPLGHDLSLPPVPPNHRRGTLWMARLALLEGQYNDVIEISYALRLDEDIEAGRLVVVAYIKLGSYKEAVEIWKQTREQDIDFLLDQVKQTSSPPDNVLNFLAVAYEIDEEEFAIPLARTLIDQGEIVKATELLNAVLTNYKKSEYRHTWMQILVYLLRIQQKWFIASEVLAAWSVEFPDDIEYLIQSGWVHYEGYGDTSKALSLFHQAISLSPSDGAGYVSVARLLSLEGSFSEAETYYSEAVRLYDVASPVWLLLERANNVQASGDLANALTLYDNLVELYPDYSLGYCEQARVYYLDKQYTRAWNQLTQAMKSMANLDNDGNVRCMEIAENAGHIALAKSFAMEVLRQNPNNIKALDALSRLSR